jgi:signal peptidase I
MRCGAEWKLQTTKNSIKDRRPVTRGDTWVFKDGKVTIIHILRIPRESTYYDQSAVNYDSIVGKLKVEILGVGRFDMFTVVEKTKKI